MTEHTTFWQKKWALEIADSKAGIGSEYQDSLSDCIAEADAAIVTACNCRAELLEALKEARTVLTSICTPNDQQVLQTLSNIVKAIRNAEEQVSG